MTAYRTSSWAGAGLLWLLCVHAGTTVAAAEPSAGADLGHAVSGYVADELCAECHDEYDSYREVAMAQSFYRPSAATVIEDFADNHYYHEPSRRHYRLSLRDGEYWFKRWELDGGGREINVFETKVDWIMGSGRHVRTYLYQTPMGSLYELPIAWYTQDRKWGMQPGYEGAEHFGVLREVKRGCMFCHNAYPAPMTAGTPTAAPHTYPDDLPQGIGCQRCHGPGRRHIEAYADDEADLATVRATIVNPARLSPQRRDDVCNACHLLPAVAVTGVRRFGLDDYAFDAGEDLAEFYVSLDVDEPGRSPAQRFEINHHAYRLQQSPCYRESAGELSCLTCHDPHRKVPAAERAAHYSARCLGCHQVQQHPPIAGDGSTDDCVSCHMPQRRPRDVIEVTMTDHRIQVVPAGQDPAARITKEEANVDDVRLLDPARAPQGDLGEVYRVIGLMRQDKRVQPEVLDYLRNLLARSPSHSAEPYFDLAKGFIGAARYEEALRAVAEGERVGGVTAYSLFLGATVDIMEGRLERATGQLKRSLEMEPAQPQALYNLALAFHAGDRDAEADARLEQALALQPNLVLAWFYRGKIAEENGRHGEAVTFYRRALAIEPNRPRAYQGIVRALRASGQAQEAERYLRHAHDRN